MNTQDMLAFLGVAPDRRLLDEDLSNLPEAEQRHEPAMSTEGHERLVRAGSLLTGITLIGGIALLLYGAVQLLFNGGGAFSAVIALIGLLLAGTHWGWVHVAEYAGLTLDAHRQREIEAANCNGSRRSSRILASASRPAFSMTRRHASNALCTDQS